MTQRLKFICDILRVDQVFEGPATFNLFRAANGSGHCQQPMITTSPCVLNCSKTRPGSW
ncbi:hypothetical protein SBV1_1750007 [Verrucomicrobia bacterium]|nr:hypothetical protein SBV1_1750007 [Verrucomicrobiota bacterium]